MGKLDLTPSHFRLSILLGFISVGAPGGMIRKKTPPCASSQVDHVSSVNQCLVLIYMPSYAGSFQSYTSVAHRVFNLFA